MPNPNGRQRTGLYPQANRLDLAEMTGLSRSTVSGILNGTRSCHLEQARVLARALSIPLETLCGALESYRIKRSLSKARIAADNLSNSLDQDLINLRKDSSTK